MIYPTLRRIFSPLSSTPLHPHWLMRRKFALRYQWIASHLSDGQLLDIGCGNQPLRAALPDTVRYVGLDYPTTTKLGYSGNPDIFGDAQRLPFADGTFDAVALLDVLEHIPVPDVALAEAVRITRPGGLVVCQTPFMYPLHDLPYDFQRWTAPGLRRLAAPHPIVLQALKPYGNAIETAATLGNIALVKSMLHACEKHYWGFLFLPLIAALVPLINLLGWLLAHILNDPDFMPLGYSAIFKKND